jgi:exosortase
MAPVEEAVGLQTAPGTVAEPEPRSLWRPVVVAVCIGILYYSVTAKLVLDWWNDPNFSHGFFVPLFSAFLVWEKRRQLSSLPVKPVAWGFLVVAGSMAVLVVGILGAELFLSRASLVFLLAGLILTFGGRKWFGALLFPWLFLFLMIPIPAIIFNQITFPLQLLASRLASILLPLFQVPVLREGNVIQLPSMPLEVAEACSGIRSLLSLGTLAIIYGYFLESNTWRRIALAIAAVPIAVAANAFRVVGTGLAVQYWDPEKGLGFFHEFSGWVIFLVSVAMLFLVHKAMRLFAKDEARAH